MLDDKIDLTKEEPKLSNFVVSPVNHHSYARREKKVVFLQKSNTTTNQY